MSTAKEIKDEPPIMLRRIEVLRGLEWASTRLSGVRKGEMFRVYEDGKPLAINDRYFFKALSAPYINEDGVWSIEI